jgi:transcriptional regulator with XRE-family HTH domain
VGAHPALVAKPSVESRFGERVRILRRKSGISQERFAAQARIDRSYIGAVERGERNVTLRNICRIAAALGISPSQLLDGVSD